MDEGSIREGRGIKNPGVSTPLFPSDVVLRRMWTSEETHQASIRLVRALKPRQGESKGAFNPILAINQKRGCV